MNSNPHVDNILPPHFMFLYYIISLPNILISLKDDRTEVESRHKEWSWRFHPSFSSLMMSSILPTFLYVSVIPKTLLRIRVLPVTSFSFLHTFLLFFPDYFPILFSFFSSIPCPLLLFPNPIPPIPITSISQGSQSQLS